MSGTQASHEFGNRRARYGGSLVKAIANGIIALGLIPGGAALIVEGWPSPLVLLGALLLLAGLFLLYSVVTRQICRSVTLFDEGVVIKRLGESLRLRYEDIDDVATVVGRPSTKPTRIRNATGYKVFVRDELVHTVSSDLAGWAKLGQQLQEAVVAARVPRLLERLQAGDAVRFTGMMTGNYLAPQPLTLTLSKQGIQVNDGLVLPWASGSIALATDEWNTPIARVRSGDQSVKFLMENYPNSNVAYQLIRAYLRERDK